MSQIKGVGFGAWTPPEGWEVGGANIVAMGLDGTLCPSDGRTLCVVRDLTHLHTFVSRVSDAVMVSRNTEPECDHQMHGNGKVICDCFISALIAVLASEGHDGSDQIANIVHDVDNSLASQRLGAPEASDGKP